MRVYQSFGTAPDGTATEQNVFVFGPKYDLHRYTDSDEKELLPVNAYSYDWTNGGTVELTGVFEEHPVGYKLDTDFTRVFAENAYVATGVVFPQVGQIEIDGNYLDGVIRIPDTDVDVKVGEYVCFQKDGASVFMRIKEVAKPGDEETDTVITFSDGLPDDLVIDSSDGPDTFVSGVAAFPVAYAGSFELPKTSWTADDEKVVIADQDAEDTYAGFIDGESKPLVQADLYVGYRFGYAAVSAIEPLLSQSDVVKEIGKVTPDNPLALGAYNAFIGGAPVVYTYATAGDSAEAFNEALKRAEMQRTMYFLVPMSQKQEVLDAVVAHVKKMSDENSKKWRIAFFCSASDSESKTSVKVVGVGKYKSKQTLKVDDFDGEYAPGDVLKVGDGDDAREFVVDRMLNVSTMLTTSAYDETYSITEDTPAVLTHVYSANEEAHAIAAKAKGYGTFRAVDCFPKTYGYSGVTYSSMYLAPILAGIAASVEPQAPITNKIIPAVDDLPDTYSKYDEKSLDMIAAGGVMIAMQDLRNSEVYVRKQLTTGVYENNLLTAELSCVKNADSVSLTFNGVLDEFKGSYNVTPGLVELVRLRLTDVIHDLENNQTDPLIGPQLLTGSEVLDVYVDPSNVTRIIAHVRCIVPAPFNEMDLFLAFEVTTEVETAEITTEE